MIDVGHRYKPLILKVSMNIDIVKLIAFQLQSAEIQISLKLSILHLKSLTVHIKFKRSLSKIICSKQSIELQFFSIDIKRIR